MNIRRGVVLFFILIFLAVGGFFYFKHVERQSKEFRVTFLNVGQGDAALINFENGQKMLVDCGPDKRVLSELGNSMAFYDRTIDYVLVTHSHLDHYGGCVDVLKRYAVKHIIVNGKRNHDSFWKEWEHAIAQEGSVVTIMDKPDSWTIASDTLEFFSPDPTLSLKIKDDDANNYSIVFKLTHSSQTFLFTGDMELPLEQALIQKYCSNAAKPCRLQSNVLKAGHHGSDTSSSKDFLTRVKPLQAIVSVGQQNKFGHPSLRVIRRLERLGTQILRTDELGAIIMR